MGGGQRRGEAGLNREVSRERKGKGRKRWSTGCKSGRKREGERMRRGRKEGEGREGEETHDDGIFEITVVRGLIGGEHDGSQHLHFSTI
jgi:hypothetical protein